MTSAECPVCGMKVRVTKLGNLAEHRDDYHHPCANSGSTVENWQEHPSETRAGRESAAAGRNQTSENEAP